MNFSLSMMELDELLAAVNQLSDEYSSPDTSSALPYPFPFPSPEDLERSLKFLDSVEYFLKENQISLSAAMDPEIVRDACTYAIASEVNCNHGDSLAEVIAAICNEPHEIVAMFDAAGRKLHEHTDHDPRMVTSAQPTYVDRDKISIIVHNHRRDTTFSVPDLRSIVNFNAETAIVATPHCTFYLHRPQAGWPQTDEWFEDFQNIAENLKYTSRRHYTNDELRHQALLRVTEHHQIGYYAIDTADHSMA